MKLIRSLIFSSLMLAVVFIAGCNEEPTTSNEPVSTSQQFSKFSLPPGATLNSAILHIYIGGKNYETVNIYGISSDWTETGVTWNTKPTTFPSVEGSFTADASGWKTIDITELVNKWLDGTYTNYGLLLDQVDQDLTFATYQSKETTEMPFIEVVYSGGSAIVPDIADAYIWEINPNTNYNYDILYTGYVNDYEKQSLLKFDIEPTQYGGCTLTPGYWKTHSEFGPAPYDNTWAQLPNGASTPFFLSGQTYYQVLWTSPAGNAYYNLSFHYIAAGLNFMNGADPSAAQAAWDAAKVLFETYTPAQIAGLKGNNSLRQQFISLAGILGNYNEGLIGPGHCDD